MLTLRAWVVIALVAAASTFAGEYFGFAIVHSGALLFIVALIAPGFYVAFLNLLPNDSLTYIGVFAGNAIYYFLIVLVVRSRTKQRSLKPT